MAVTVDDICARVEADRQQARIDALVETLRKIAEHYDDDAHLVPDDSYWPNGEDNFSKHENWNAAFQQGKRRGEWELGALAEKALDQWEASA